MQRTSTIALALAVLTTAACESRADKMREQLAYDSAGPKDGNPADEVPTIPPDPTRDALAPLLTDLYAADALPDVQDGPVSVEGQDFEIMKPGALAYINVKAGLSEGEKAKAIIRATAEADAFAVRSDADRYFSEQLAKIKNSFGEEERERIRAVYGDLRLLDYFASEKAEAAIAKLSGEHKTAAEALRDEYLADKDAIWERWMGVKMYARRVVAYDQPFKPLLRSLRKQFDMKEPEPITWEAAHDEPFKAWASEIDKDDELFKMLTNLSELRDQEEFRGDTHARWAMKGSSMIPEEAKGTKFDAELGFGIYREDLGGGFQEITFIFDSKMKGNALKEAYLRSLIYRQVFTDFATLSAAGGDFKSQEIPNEYDPDYAYCASRMALDGMINDFGDEKPLLEGLEAQITDEEKLVTEAVECILVRLPMKSGLNRGVPDDEARPPAPATRNAFFQMLARFTKVDVNLENMKKDTQKSQEVLDAEAFLKDFDDERKKEMR